MTMLEKFNRMETCARCTTGDCEIGRDAPVDCGCCSGYVGVWSEDREVNNRVDLSGVKIYVPADELWIFYIQNEDRCKKEMVLIAENTDTKYEVYLTVEDDVVMLSVCRGEDEPEYEEYVLNNDDCTKTAKKLFMRYLIPISIVDGKAVIPGELPEDQDDNTMGPSRQDIEDEMYEREDELDLAMKDFLSVVLQEPDIDLLIANHTQGFVDEVLDNVLSLLAIEFCCEIYRPMFIEDEETGCEIYTQFPYEKKDSDVDSEGGGDDA